MADEQHLEILRQGVNVWNQWRKNNRGIKPCLNQANLNHASLYQADLNCADLQRADFQRAFLNKVNLRNANLHCAKLQSAKFQEADLSGAKLEGAILKDAKLEGAILNNANLHSTNLKNAFLNNANLQRAILKDTNLSNANLYNANLNQANLKDALIKCAFLYSANIANSNLSNANLQSVNLSKVNALATNFEGATLTGACIEDWNINAETNFQNVKCDYIYLKGIFSKEKRGFIFSDRRPHDPNKIFAPGEFTKRYQKLLETVDIYFDDGIDWQAFLVSFNKLQIECDSDELSINSFENKGDGAFVIKVNLPNNADKAEIEKYLEKQYQLEATVEAQQRELTNLYEVTKLLASKPTIIENNIDNQNGKFGIGHNESDISGNAKIAGEINQVGQQKADK